MRCLDFFNAKLDLLVSLHVKQQDINTLNY